jgi:hypothetical protein
MSSRRFLGVRFETNDGDKLFADPYTRLFETVSRCRPTSPWWSESEKQNVPNQESGDVLILVKLQKHVLVYGGGLKVEVGAEFFLPYWLVAQLSFNLLGIRPGRKARSESRVRLCPSSPRRQLTTFLMPI